MKLREGTGLLTALKSDISQVQSKRAWLVPIVSQPPLPFSVFNTPRARAPGKKDVVLVEGRHPSSDPNHGRDDAVYDSEEEERDLHHQDMYMNGGRNHHFGPPPTQEG